MIIKIISTVVPDWYRTRVWEVKKVDQEKNAVAFGLYSPDMDQGFPGNFTVQVTYTLTEDNEIQIHYEGTADQDTIVNMTNHSYFNLADMRLEKKLFWIIRYRSWRRNIRRYLIQKLFPQGDCSCSGNAYDFQEPKKIGQDLEADFEQP